MGVAHLYGTSTAQYRSSLSRLAYLSAEPSVLRRCLAIVAVLAERLQVGRIKQQLSVPLVWCDVVNH